MDHIIDIHVSAERDCGDTWCTGHTDRTLVCSCGYQDTIYGDASSKIRAHYFQVLNDALGIKFEVRNLKDWFSSK